MLEPAPQKQATSFETLLQRRCSVADTIARAERYISTHEACIFLSHQVKVETKNGYYFAVFINSCIIESFRDRHYIFISEFTSNQLRYNNWLASQIGTSNVINLTQIAKLLGHD